ncbi:MAG: hypothetical protein EB084_02565, partial [Proteobacteria bacterium]|nr:hypothetical protein [Pseudomonadota bacterium]
MAELRRRNQMRTLRQAVLAIGFVASLAGAAFVLSESDIALEQSPKRPVRHPRDLRTSHKGASTLTLADAGKKTVRPSMPADTPS